MMISVAYLIKFLTVMLSMILADICWTKYFMVIADRKVLAAGIWSAAIILFGAICTTEYVTDRTLIVAAMLGAFIGSSLTVKLDKAKNAK
jgi:hypothetical protein